MKKVFEFPEDSPQPKGCKDVSQAYHSFVKREKSIPKFSRPQTASEGMRFLAKWFDFVYQDQGTNDAVQIDLRRWADDLDMIKEMAAEPYKSELEVRNALFRIHQRLSN